MPPPEPALTHFLCDGANPCCISARLTGRQHAGFPVPCNTPLVLAAVRHTTAGRNRRNPGAGDLWRSESTLIQAPSVGFGLVQGGGCLAQQSFNRSSCGFAWRVRIRQREPRLSYSVMVHAGVPISTGRPLQVLPRAQLFLLQCRRYFSVRFARWLIASLFEGRPFI